MIRRLGPVNASNGSTHDPHARFRLEQPHAFLEDLALITPAKQVQHHPEMDILKCPFQLLQLGVWVENVALHEFGLQRLSVPEEVAAEFDERPLEFQTVQLLGSGAICDKFADVLA
jgi:hypothetical protein